MKMAYASDIIKSREYKISNSKNNNNLLESNKIRLINYPKDYFIEYHNADFLLKTVFGRKNVNHKLLSYGDIKKWGWIICQGSASYLPYRFFPGQQVYFYLHDESKPIKAGHYSMPVLPPDHRIRMKIRERLILLEGRNAGPSGHGSWKNIETKTIAGVTQKRRRLMQIARSYYRKKLKRWG
mgnify:CR=1 FL=1